MSKGKRTEPKELIKKATFNLNNTRSAKYGIHQSKLKNKHLNPIQENAFKMFMIFIV